MSGRCHFVHEVSLGLHHLLDVLVDQGHFIQASREHLDASLLQKFPVLAAAQCPFALVRLITDLSRKLTVRQSLLQNLEGPGTVTGRIPNLEPRTYLDPFSYHCLKTRRLGRICAVTSARPLKIPIDL